MKKEINSLQEKVGYFYFKPKSFEKNGKLYECLGVKIFGKYCPNGGSYWMEESHCPKQKTKEENKNNLKGLIAQTYEVEAAHSFFLVPIFTIAAAINLAFENYESAGVETMLNFIVNFYPIVNQRYVRNKTNKILEKYFQDEGK